MNIESIPNTKKIPKLQHTDKDIITTTSEEISRIVKIMGPLLNTFSSDTSIKFTPSTELSTFAFFPEKHEVKIPISWFVENKYSTEEVVWALHHELGHFIDMRKNPQKFLENFKKMQELSKEIEEIFIDQMKKHNLSDQEIARYKENIKKKSFDCVHTLYNVLDDIYVNNVVATRSPKYSFGDGKGIVSGLYRKIGYAKSDLQDLKLHQQFYTALLRDEMLGDTDGQSIVSDDTKIAFDNIKYFGKDLNTIIENNLHINGGKLNDPNERYDIIRRAMLPTYIDLIRKDIEKINFNNDNIVEVLESFGGKRQNNDPDSSINPETLKEILKQFIKDEKIKSSTPEKRAKYILEDKKKKFDEKYNINDETRQLYEKSKFTISQLRDEMRHFWKSLISGKGTDYDKSIIPRTKRGNLNINELISKYPDLIDSQKTSGNPPHIYDRTENIIIPTNIPESIEISFVCDVSSSMSYKKLRVLQDTILLFLLSLKDFNDFLDEERNNLNTRLSTKTDVYKFNDTFEIIKHMDTQDHEEADIIKIFESLRYSKGGTNDVGVLNHIVNEIDDDKERKIKDGKIKKIIFEITDGDTIDPPATRKAIDAMLGKGVLPISFQIGYVTEKERNRFNEIWNTGRDIADLGIHIGTQLSELPKVLMEIIKENMRQIKILQ